MICEVCNLEYTLHQTPDSCFMIDENYNQIYLDLSIMACPRCGQVDESTLQLRDLDLEDRKVR
jgi:hypothetical protein